MSIETAAKPLHVRVAEALGWAAARCICEDRPHLAGESCLAHPPRYDTDWAATGPLIALYGIGLVEVDGGLWAAFRWEDGEWMTLHGSILTMDGTAYLCGRGDTPLIAICEVILALKAEGKLPEILPPVSNGVLPDLADPSVASADDGEVPSTS